jgi:hypothetical protein
MLDSNLSLTKTMTHHTRGTELDESIDNKRHKVCSSNPRPHEAQQEDQKRQEKLKKVI